MAAARWCDRTGQEKGRGKRKRKERRSRVVSLVCGCCWGGCGTRRRSLQVVHLLVYLRPFLFVFLRSLRCVRVGVVIQNHVAKLGRHARKMLLRKAIEQVGVGLVGQ